MKKFRRFAFFVVLAEILFIVVGNLIWQNTERNSGDRMYRVEAARIRRELETLQPDDIDLDKYSCITKVSEFDPDIICNSDYTVEKVGETLYRIEYTAAVNGNGIIFINLALAVLPLASSALFIYIDRKILKPFSAMDKLTSDLARGNLSTPVKEEKSRYFGRFLWGIDMLREKLEKNKVREIEIQRDRKTLILSLSHDIKTPLSAIELYEKALAENLYDTEEKRLEALEAIRSNAEEIRNYVSQISSAAREDFIDLDVTVGEVYLSSVIGKIKAYYTDKLSVLHTEFNVAPFSDCLIRGEDDRIVEVFQNIIENAIKYGDGVDISLSFDEEEDCRIVYVENSGCSLDKVELTNIFDSFFRGSNSKEKKGSGLGLYISRKLMRKMDGDVFAEIHGDRFCAAIVLRKV